MLLLRRPARRDAHDGHVALLLPEAHGDVCGEAGELRRIERGEDLVCRAVDGVCVPLLDEGSADAVRHTDGVRPAALIEPVRKERIELNAEHAPLRQKSSVLLDNGEEMRHRVRLREDDCLAEERTALRPADVECIREACDGGEGQLVCRAAERVRETRPVEEERNLVRTADGADDLELVHGVERPVLRRVREVDHAGAHHVIAVRVFVIRTQTALDGACREFAVRVREREHLVAAALDCARLVHRDMPRICGNHALIGMQQR